MTLCLKGRKIIALATVCAILFVAGCSGVQSNTEKVNETQEQAADIQVDHEQQAKDTEETAAPTHTVTSTATPAPINSSALPTQVRDTEDAKDKKTITGKSTGSNGNGQSNTDNSGSSGSMGSNEAENNTTSTTATATPAPDPASTATPTPTSTPTPTPQPTEQPQAGGAMCHMCKVTIPDSELVAHMKHHAINDGGGGYDTE